MVKQNNRIYQRATFKTPNGKRQVILFDVTAAFQSMRTTWRIFPGGTMVRLTPSTGSTPTRMQVLVLMTLIEDYHTRHNSFETIIFLVFYISPFYGLQ